MAASAPNDPAGWQPVDGLAPVADEYVAASLDEIREITHPLRGALLRRLVRGASVAELAAGLGVPATRLYHHIKRLETAGLIRVDATRRSGAVTERRYATVARSFKIDQEMLASDDHAEIEQAVLAMFDVGKAAMARRFEQGPLDDTPGHDTLLSFNDLRLTPSRRAEFTRRMLALADEFDDDEGEPYFAMLVGIPGES